MSTEGGTKAVVAAALANTSIAVMKFGAWLLTGAASMLAEAIHSFADTGNQVLLLIGGAAAKKPADDRHPFGYGRNRYVYGFLVSIVLFSVGGLFALFEAYEKFQHVLAGAPDPLLESTWWWVPLVVLTGAIIAESISFRTAIVESKKTKGRRSWWGFVREAKSPELPVILLEDLAALIGLFFALVGVGLTLLTHQSIFDVIGTALIGLLLIAVAIVLAIETKSMLVGEAAMPEQVAQIRAALEATPGVASVIHLKTLHLGPEEIMVATKIAVEGTTAATEVATTIDAAERAIRSHIPQAAYIFIEPDIARCG